MSSSRYNESTLCGNWFEDRSPTLSGVFEKSGPETRDFSTTHATGFVKPEAVPKRTERSMLDFQRYTEIPESKLVDERGFAVMSGVEATDTTVDYSSTAQRAALGCYGNVAGPTTSLMQDIVFKSKPAGVSGGGTQMAKGARAPPPFAIYE